MVRFLMKSKHRSTVTRKSTSNGERVLMLQTRTTKSVPNMVYYLTFDMLSCLFDIPSTYVAVILEVSPSCLKQIRAGFKIERWPCADILRGRTAIEPITIVERRMKLIQKIKSNEELKDSWKVLQRAHVLASRVAQHVNKHSQQDPSAVSPSALFGSFGTADCNDCNSTTAAGVISSGTEISTLLSSSSAGGWMDPDNSVESFLALLDSHFL